MTDPYVYLFYRLHQMSKILRSLGMVFAVGNIGEAFQHFPKQHSCNLFCHDFGLEALCDTADRAAYASDSEYGLQ
jgi:hypothetical protein